ncbi:MAG: DNA primase [Acidiferrobacteraceae bacterium]|nr:DNA primase [Acidiferrobacteraceae bacterium]
MSGRIPREFIDELLARTDIVELIDARVPLTKAGRDFKACCPFHNEKTPSFTVSQTKQFYHCFGCSANGSAIGFLMEFEHLSFREAIEELAQNVGLEIPDTGPARAEDTLTPALLDALADANRFFKEQLRSHEMSAEAVAYLKERGLSGEVAALFELGLAPAGWDTLSQTAQGDSKMLDLMAKAGLVARKDSGRFYDRFRSRVIFPIHDYKGRVVAFGGRILGDGEPKYLNSPETPVFQKGSELYNLHRARSNIAQQGHSVVVEGYMDVVALAQHGIEHAVATLGTATTPRHLERLFRLAPSIIFCFDGDRAGRAAAWRALETALPELGGGRQISFLFLPDGDDPDSLIRREGGPAFSALVTKATSLPDFLFKKLSAETDLGRIDGRARLVELAKPLLAKIPEGPLRELMHQRLREETGVQSTEQARTPQGHRPPSRRQTSTQRLSPMATAISLLLQQPGLAARYALPENLDEEADEPGLKLLKNLHKIAGEEPSLTTGALLERFRDTEDSIALEKLAGKDHLLEEHDFSPFFSETLLTLQEQALGKSIDKLVARAAKEDLDESSKGRLAALYLERQSLRQRREEGGK